MVRSSIALYNYAALSHLVIFICRIGSFGVHCSVDTNDRNLIEFYNKLGFVEIGHGMSSEQIYLGRIF